MILNIGFGLFLNGERTIEALGGNSRFMVGIYKPFFCGMTINSGQKNRYMVIFNAAI